jgi:hypothetical protein
VIAAILQSVMLIDSLRQSKHLQAEPDSGRSLLANDPIHSTCASNPLRLPRLTFSNIKVPSSSQANVLGSTACAIMQRTCASDRVAEEWRYSVEVLCRKSIYLGVYEIVESEASSFI